jgi:hypothetical protein
MRPDLSKCPQCGGVADNGHDRCYPPNPYYCTKCEKEPMTPDIVLVAYRPSTGEIVNRDGTVGGKVVPVEITQQMIFADWDASLTDRSPADTEITYKAMLVASEVDLTGAVIPLPEEVLEENSMDSYYVGWNAYRNAIKAQMPKETKRKNRTRMRS